MYLKAIKDSQEVLFFLDSHFCSEIQLLHIFAVCLSQQFICIPVNI